jgi:hypothetical protein
MFAETKPGRCHAVRGSRCRATSALCPASPPPRGVGSFGRDPAADVRLGFLHLARGSFCRGDASEEGPREADIETPCRRRRPRIELLAPPSLPPRHRSVSSARPGRDIMSGRPNTRLRGQREDVQGPVARHRHLVWPAKRSVTRAGRRFARSAPGMSPRHLGGEKCASSTRPPVIRRAPHRLRRGFGVAGSVSVAPSTRRARPALVAARLGPGQRGAHADVYRA